MSKKSSLPQDLSVGEVAARAGVAVSTLHFYERRGLIQSWRTEGNQRRYSRAVLRRVGIIKVAQRLGLPLVEVGKHLSRLPSDRVPSKADWARVAAVWRTDLDARIRQMQRLRDSLDGCIGCGCLSVKTCPLHNPDDILAEKGPGPVQLDVG